jgi:HTH-type transcriptional regulator/antitoxin HipB
MLSLGDILTMSPVGDILPLSPIGYRMIVKSPADLGHLVRDFRIQRGLTQAALADEVGASRKWLIDLEAGKRTADLSLVLRTLNVLGIELDARSRAVTRTRNDAIDLDAVIARTRNSKR